MKLIVISLKNSLMSFGRFWITIYMIFLLLRIEHKTFILNRKLFKNKIL